MNLFGRFFWLILKSIFRPQHQDIFDSCKTDFYVNILDLDVNMHMNNGRYLSIMDLGRIDLMIKGGVFKRLVTQGYYPVVASESIRFKNSLQPFKKFTLVTTIEAWDEKDFYISQKFVCAGEVAAFGFIKGRFKQRGRKGSVSTPELFSLIGKTYEGPKRTDLADLQRDIEKLLN